MDKLGSLDADPGRLQELFENLFRNAVEHAGDETTVRVGELADGFFVEDDGPGIPLPEDREAVFEHGHTTAKSGSGLGLSIVKTIANAHGWSIAVPATDRTAGLGFGFARRSSPANPVLSAYTHRNPSTVGAGSGLDCNPALGSGSLYPRGATSFGPFG